MTGCRPVVVWVLCVAFFMIVMNIDGLGSIEKALDKFQGQVQDGSTLCA